MPSPATVAAWSKVEIIRFGPIIAGASFRAPVLLARSQGPRPQADPGRPGQARSDGDRARRDRRQERGAPGLARARISALRRRRQPSQGGPRLPLSLRARRRHQCGPHRQVRGRGMARGLGLREGVPRPCACRPLLSRAERGDARPVQGLRHRHRAGARPETRQAARSESRRGQTEACRVLAERTHLRQRRRQSRRREGDLRARRLRPGGGARIAGGRELDPVRPRSRHHGLERHRSADRDVPSSTRIRVASSRRCASP